MAQQADGTVYINTLLDTTGFKAGGKDVEAAVRRMSKTVSGIGETAKIALQKQTDAFVKSNQAYARQERKVESLKKKLQEMSEQRVATNEFSELGKLIDSDRAKLNRLEAAQEKFLATGGKTNSSAYRKREMDIEELRSSIQNARKEQQQLLESGGAYESVDTSAAEQQLADAAQRLQQMDNSLATSFSSLTQKIRSLGGGESGVERLKSSIIELRNSVNNVLHPIEAVKSSFLSFAQKLEDKAAGIAAALINGIAHPFQTVKNIAKPAIRFMEDGLKRIGSSAKSAAKSIGGSLLSGAKKLSFAMLGLGKNTKNSGNAFGVGLKTILKYGFGIRSLYALVRKLKQAIKDGFSNLAQYSEPVNASISSLMSALTQLKNSLATAFAPILNVVAPILTVFINMISRAVTYVGMLIAALTGQKTYAKAKAVQEDYAASIGKTVGAAEDAAKSTKKAEKAAEGYLSPLDQINKMEKKEDASGAGGSGGAGGGGGISPSDMFETVPIESGIKGIADKIKKLVESEDWEGLGAYIAGGINKGLQKIYDAISWDTVGPKITYFVNAFTTTFNSVVDHIDWDLLGRTIGTGINTVVNTLTLLIDGIDWENLGRKFAEGVNGLVDEVDWKNVGRLIGKKFMILPTVLLGFVKKADWKKIGKAVADALNGVVETVDLSKTGELLGTALTGIFTAAIEFSKNFDWKALGTNIYKGINAFFETTDWAAVGKGISDFAKGLLDALITAVEGVDWTQVAESVKTFLANVDWSGIIKRIAELLGAAAGGLAAVIGGLIGDAFTSAKKYWKGKIEECGGSVIKGVFKGISDGLSSIGEWIRKHIVDPFVKGFKKAFGINSPSKVMKEQAKCIVDGLLEGIKEKWTGFIEYWGKKKDEIVKKFEKIKEDFSKKGKEIIDGIKSGIAEKWSAFKEDWSKKKNNIVDAFKDIKEKFKAKGNSIISGIKSGIAEKWSDFSTYWKAKKDKIVDTFKTIKEKFKSKGGSIISGIKAGIAEKWSDFSTYWKGKKDKVVDAFKNIKEDFKKKGKDIINGIIEGIQAVWNKITSWADKIKSAFNIKVSAGSGGTQASTARSTYSANGLKIPKPVNMPMPYLATGAVIPPNAPFMAMLGDQKKGTNVEAPLETIKQAVRDVMRESGRGKGATYSFTAKLDRRTIFNEVITEAKLRQGQSGRNPFELA